MSSWQALEEEAVRWRDGGRTAALWWRDDDAADAGPAFDRLLTLHRDTRAPLSLAVVPALATPALADRLGAEPDVDLLQHGYAHLNHASPGEKKAELGAHRPAMIVLGELGTGWLALERLFGGRAQSVMVPPWNRIAPGLVPTLPEIGFRGLSTFGPRRRARPVSGLLQMAVSRARRRCWAPWLPLWLMHAPWRTSRLGSSVIILRWTAGRGIS